MTLLAGSGAAPSLHGRADFRRRHAGSGAHAAERRGYIGLFADTLVLHADVSVDPDFRTLLATVRETTLGSSAHQDAPFEPLVEALAGGAQPGADPLFQVSSPCKHGDLRPRLGGMDVERFGVHGGGALVDLTVSLVETDGGIEGLVESAPTCSMRRRSSGSWTTSAVLLTAAADPSAPVSTLPMLADADARRCWRGPRNPDGGARESVLEMIAAHVARTTGAVAIGWRRSTRARDDGSVRITYAGAGRARNRLTHRSAPGCGHEARVGAVPGAHAGAGGRRARHPQGRRRVRARRARFPRTASPPSARAGAMTFIASVESATSHYRTAARSSPSTIQRHRRRSTRNRRMRPSTKSIPSSWRTSSTRPGRRGGPRA